MPVYIYNNRMVGKEGGREKETEKREGENVAYYMCIIHICSTYTIDFCVCIHEVLIQRAEGMLMSTTNTTHTLIHIHTQTYMYVQVQRIRKKKLMCVPC